MPRKPARFASQAKDAIRAFPADVQSEMGYQLDLVQQGLPADDFKPMKTAGAGVYEIRVRDEGRAFRSFYVARFEEAVYVLHAFEKKSQKTAPKDIAVGQARYRALVEARGRSGFA